MPERNRGKSQKQAYAEEYARSQLFNSLLSTDHGWLEAQALAETLIEVREFNAYVTADPRHITLAKLYSTVDILLEMAEDARDAGKDTYAACLRYERALKALRKLDPSLPQ